MNKNFSPGDKIWVVERDTDGNVYSIIWYYFISEVAGYVIVSNSSNSIDGKYGINDLMACHAQETAENYVDLSVFPVADCFSTQEAVFAAIENENKQFYLDECDKLDVYSDNLNQELRRKRKELNKLIKEKEKEYRASTSLPLDQIIAIKDEINRLKDRRKKMQREIYQQEDEIDMQRDKLQEEIRQKLNGTTEITHITTITFEVV